MNEVLTVINSLWPLLGVAGAVVSGWLLWQLSRRFVLRADHAALVVRVNALEEGQQSLSDALARIEGRLSSLPTLDDMHHIDLGLEEVRGGQKELSARMEGQAKLLERMERPLNIMMEAHIKGEI